MTEHKEEIYRMIRLLGEKPSVKIYYCDTIEFKVDLKSKEVFLPKLSCLSTLSSEEALKVLKGGAVHEAGHLRMTPCEEYTPHPTPQYRALVNILEDGRIERNFEDTYPGTKPFLKSLNAFCFSLMPKERNALDTGLFALFPWAKGDSLMLESLLDSCTEARKMIELLDDLLVYTQDFDLWRNSKLAFSTVLLLADEIYKRWNIEKKLQQNGPENKNSRWMQGVENLLEEMIVPQESVQHEQCAETEMEETTDVTQPIEEVFEDEVFEDEMFDDEVFGFVYVEDAEDAEDANGSNYGEDEYSEELLYAPYVKNDLEVQATREKNPQTDEFYNEIKKFNHIKQRFADAFLEEEIISRLHLQRKGSLDSVRLHRAFIDGNCFFQRLERDKHLDVAFSLLIDYSGSMNNDNKLNLAQQLACFIAMLCKLNHIPFEILAFTTHDNTANEPDDSIFYTRRTPLMHVVVKSFSQPWSTDALLNSLEHSGGANVDGEAVAWAASRLNHRDETNKILLVLSDGHPSSSDDDEDLERHLKRTVTQYSHSTRIFALGIQDDAVEKFYPNHLVVHDLETFVRKGLEQFFLFLRSS